VGRTDVRDHSTQTNRGRVRSRYAVPTVFTAGSVPPGSRRCSGEEWRRGPCRFDTGPELVSGPERGQLLAGRSAPDRAVRWMALRVDGRAHPSRGRSFVRRLYELVEARTSGFVSRTARSGSLTRTDRARAGSSSRGTLLAERLFGISSARESAEWAEWETVNDRSSVSAFGSSPIRQREVLLARVLLPLRAKSVDRKGSKRGRRRRGIAP